MGSGSSLSGWRTAGVMLLGGALIIFLLTAFVGPDLIRAAVEGRSGTMADRYLSIDQSLDPETRTPTYYIEQGIPALFRLAGTLAFAGSLFFIFAAGLRRAFTDFLSETAGAEDLALFRITVFAAMLWWWWNNPLGLFSSLPAALVVPPPGVSWAVEFLPRQPWIVEALSLAFAIACSLAMIGYRTRWSSAAAATLAVVVLGVPQFYGKIDHYHHFVWFSALLAASPSGDRWSVDAWRLRGGVDPPTGPNGRYGAPMRSVLLLMGLIYLFAGLWKFIIGGVEWGTGETMRTILHAQWMRIDHVPFLRVDDLGFWTSFGGLVVMLFEVSFLALVLNRRTRLWAAAAGVLFHLSVLIFTGINFWTLLVCYTVFANTSWFRRSRSPVVGTPEQDAATVLHSRAFSWVRNGLVAAALTTGMLLIDSWPVAVYPTFAGVAQPRMWTLTFEAVSPEGQVSVVRPWKSGPLRSRYGNSRVAGFVSQVVWAPDSIQRHAKAVALMGVVGQVEPSITSAQDVHFYRDLVEVDPARWNAQPARRELIGTWSGIRD